jgi:hypothetical protein
MEEGKWIAAFIAKIVFPQAERAAQIGLEFASSAQSFFAANCLADGITDAARPWVDDKSRSASEDKIATIYRAVALVRRCLIFFAPVAVHALDNFDEYVNALLLVRANSPASAYGMDLE